MKRDPISERLLKLLWGDPPYRHEEIFGCTVTVSNAEFGTGGSGCCELCYCEYPALFADVECTCPKQVPGKKNPEKLRANPNRINFKRTEIDLSGHTLEELIP